MHSTTHLRRFDLIHCSQAEDQFNNSVKQDPLTLAESTSFCKCQSKPLFYANRANPASTTVIVCVNLPAKISLGRFFNVANIVPLGGNNAETIFLVFRHDRVSGLTVGNN